MVAQYGRVNAMEQEHHPTIVAAPEISFAQIQAVLIAAGWVLESQSETPLLASEPEVAVFVSPRTQSTIHYTFNPVVHFRVLQFRGPDAALQQAQIAAALPNLQEPDVRQRLGSGALREKLLGLFAAEELALINLTGAVLKLESDADSRVSRTASRVGATLLSQIFSKASTWIAGEQAAHPERSAWFHLLSGVELKKQVLRWLMHDFAASNESIDLALRSALADSDTEVRITAVIAAARLNAKKVGRELREAVIPTSTRDGADPRDRFFFERLRQTALRYLATEPAATSSINDQRQQFRKAIHGELEVHDDPTLLMHSLTMPLEPVERPNRLPEAVEERDGSYFLRRSGLALCWVGQVAHWLGEDSRPGAPVKNPIRKVTPSTGFFITDLPLSAKIALWSSEPSAMPPAIESADNAPFSSSYEVAAHLGEVFSALEGARLQLPSADQWEMAARGTDGRRYSWGNCLRPDGQSLPSPWGMKKSAGDVLEWTSDASETGAHVVCGGPVTAPCAARLAVSGADATQCGVRFVLEGYSE